MIRNVFFRIDFSQNVAVPLFYILIWIFTITAFKDGGAYELFETFFFLAFNIECTICDASGPSEKYNYVMK